MHPGASTIIVYSTYSHIIIISLQDKTINWQNKYRAYNNSQRQAAGCMDAWTGGTVLGLSRFNSIKTAGEEVLGMERPL